VNLTVTVLEIVAPVFILAGLGFAWVKAGLAYPTEFVTHLAMTLAVPCLIFHSLVGSQLDPTAIQSLSLATVGTYGAITLAMLALCSGLRLDGRTHLTPMIFGNTGNIGLPLCLFAFGDTGLSYGIVVFAIMAIWNFTYGVWTVTGGGSIVPAFKEPMVGATLLGGLFLWQGWAVPGVVSNTLGLIGQMAIPLMLITLGVAVARLTPGRLRKALGLSVLKLALCTGLAWGVGRWFTLDPVAFGVLVLQAAMPVAVTSYLLAEKYGADGKSVAGFVVVSTLLSVATLPVLLALLL